MYPSTPAERLLTLLLRLGGVLTGCAVFAVFLPEASMASIHRALGLGAFPAAPITAYLTRSISAMYAIHGVLLLALSTDVRRHLPVIRWLGWATCGLGVALTAIDLGAPMPTWWTLAEGPPVFFIGLFMVWLTTRAAREAASEDAP